MGTFTAKSATIQRDWYLINAEGKTLGRLASVIAARLRGKHKVEFTPHMDMGDYMVVINADKVHVTGNKLKDKCYQHYSGYPGGLVSHTLGEMLAKTPARVLELAVRGMLPKGPLGRQMFRKLKVCVGDKHPYAAQQLKVLDI